MNYLKYTEFRNHSKEYFDKVEQEGDEYVIIKKGKPIAKIIPFDEKTPGWKREHKKVTLKKDKSTLDYIRAEREEK